jgi:hypothetical protein
MKSLIISAIFFLGFQSAQCQSLPDAPKSDSFLANQTNQWLTRADFAVRMNDAISTYVVDGSGICPTCHEDQLPKALSKSLPGMLAYSEGVHLGVTFAARELWNHNHHKLARAVLIGDVVGDGVAGFGNWRLAKNFK